jgi:hypothetical protein
MIMLRENRANLGFRLDIVEDWFLLVEKEINNVQKSQINLRGKSEVDKTAPLRAGLIGYLLLFYLLGFLYSSYRPKMEGKLFLPPTHTFIHRCLGSYRR